MSRMHNVSDTELKLQKRYTAILLQLLPLKDNVNLLAVQRILPGRRLPAPKRVQTVDTPLQLSSICHLFLWIFKYVGNN